MSESPFQLQYYTVLRRSLFTGDERVMYEKTTLDEIFLQNIGSTINSRNELIIRRWEPLQTEENIKTDILRPKFPGLVKDVFIRCRSHNPQIISSGPCGTTKTLLSIHQDLCNREFLIKVFQQGFTLEKSPRKRLIKFLVKHPLCVLDVIDETGFVLVFEETDPNHE